MSLLGLENHSTALLIVQGYDAVKTICIRQGTVVYCYPYGRHSLIYGPLNTGLCFNLGSEVEHSCSGFTRTTPVTQKVSCDSFTTMASTGIFIARELLQRNSFLLPPPTEESWSATKHLSCRILQSL